MSAFALATLLAATAAWAQDSAATFEVAAIKPSNPDPTNPLSMVPTVRPQPGGRLSQPIPLSTARALTAT